MYLGNDANPHLVLIKIKDTAAFVAHNDTKLIYHAAFDECPSLIELTLPRKIRFIAVNSLSSICTQFEKINYGGTVKEWQAVAKPIGWRDNYIVYPIHCTDDVIPKAEG